jgi:O-antigen/teichoic acid export membrane protein
MVLTVGQGVGQILAFVRNVVVARLLSPHDVGVAATLAITLSLVDLLADLSIDKLLIQADNGDEARMRATAQLFSVCRGSIQAAGLFLLSWPVARLFQSPEATWAFQCAAVVPLIRGFAHLDVCCAQRDLRFGPAVVSEVLPQVVSLVLIWPLARWLGDFRAVLYAAMLQALLYVVCTHVTARRPYSWATDLRRFSQICTFGWPLVINGTLLFAITQGDRVAVGAAYSKEQLAVWSIALLLTSAPWTLVGRVAVSIALPILSRSRVNRSVFDDRYAAYMQGLAMIAVFMTTPMLLAGGPLMSLVFGPAYGQTGAFIGLLALGQAIRVCRFGPTMASLAYGQTSNLVAANVGRMLGVGLAITAASCGAEMIWIALSGVVGETVALGIAIWRLGARSPVAPMQSIRAFLPLAVSLSCVGLLEASDVMPTSISSLATATALVSVCVATCLLLSSKRLRREPRLLFAWLRESVRRSHPEPSGTVP